MGSTRFQAIEALAYQLWLEAGCPQGCSHDHWLEAERRVKLREALTGARSVLRVTPTLRGRNTQTIATVSPLATSMAQAVA